MSDLRLLRIFMVCLVCVAAAVSDRRKFEVAPLVAVPRKVKLGSPGVKD